MNAIGTIPIFFYRFQTIKNALINVYKCLIMSFLLWKVYGASYANPSRKILGKYFGNLVVLKKILWRSHILCWVLDAGLYMIIMLCHASGLSRKLLHTCWEAFFFIDSTTLIKIINIMIFLYQTFMCIDCIHCF